MVLVFALHGLGPYLGNFLLVQWGWAGVDLFFVISGFLITGILYDSLHRCDFFRNFYTRRALRIFPLYYGVWIVMGLLALLPGIHLVANRYMLSWLVYLGNLFEPAGRLGLHPNVEIIGLQRASTGNVLHLNVSHLWSLCVEEQYYLIWPAVVWLVRSRRSLLIVCLAVMVADPLARVWYMHTYPGMIPVDAIYLNTAFRADSLMTGAALALWLRGNNPSLRFVRRIAWGTVVTAPLALALAIHYISPKEVSYYFRNPVVMSFGFTLVAITATGLLLLTLDPTTVVARCLGHRVPVALGRVSYGMYVFMLPVTDHLDRLHALLHRIHLGFASPLLGFGVLYMLARLSSHYLESPFLKLKSKLAPRPGAADDPPPFPELQHNER